MQSNLKISGHLSRWALLGLIVVSLAGCAKSCNKQADSTDGSNTNSEVNTGVNMNVETNKGPAASTSGAVDLSVDAGGLSKTTVSLRTEKGVLKFKFYSGDAPVTVNRLVELIQSKFYNGVRFHRVVPGFVVQTGDPKSRNPNDPSVGTGGSGTKLKAEFNSRKHVRGTVAMARAQDPNSADSQFYICYGPTSHLDGSYTVVGQVIDYGETVGGKDVLDRIAAGDEVIEVKLE